MFLLEKNFFELELHAKLFLLCSFFLLLRSIFTFLPFAAAAAAAIS